MGKWEALLNTQRRKPKDLSGEKPPLTIATEVRTELERDYDRILFSTPYRRLADKTQVFPLERNASVRTRLTHSNEVANLARSIGVNLAFDHDLEIDSSMTPKRNLPALLGAIGLVHDLGNPPFGHQGERAIQKWFQRNKQDVLEEDELTKAMRLDFLHFEGNAQTLRLLTRLQLINDKYGLNLAYATLAALMKYPVPSDQINKNNISSKKFGFFQSEKEIVEDIWAMTDLKKGKRHPFTFIMEACDDVAYSVLDAEDSVKKKLVSFSDLIAYLRHYNNNNKAIKEVVEASCYDHHKYRENANLSPDELNDISMQKFRVYAIATMIGAITQAFIRHKDLFLKGSIKESLIEVSEANCLCESLKQFNKEHAFSHQTVLEVELTGYNTIQGLMDILWMAIKDRGDPVAMDAKNARWTSPYEAYVYSRISENYRRVFEDVENSLPLRYKQLQLLTDMISGMTDSYAITLLDELTQYGGH